MSHDEAARPGGFFLSGTPVCVLDSITEAVGGPPGLPDSVRARLQIACGAADPSRRWR
jgi:hypothetical protein